MTLQIYLFGTPHCMQEGQPISIHRRKAVALLAYLAATARPHGRDALATLFWPEHDQSGARANLRRDLSYLKQALGDDLLSITRTDVGLFPEAGWQLDTAAFNIRLAQVQAHDHPPSDFCPNCQDMLTRAVDLYTGDFMAGFTLPDCPEFDEWQFFQREGLRHFLATALQQLIDWCVAQGTFEQGMDYGRRWLALDLLHEPAHRTLMQLYAWGDQHSAALRQYEECLRLLDEELGVTPEAETAALYEAIKSRQLSPPAVNPPAPRPSAVTDPKRRYRQDEWLATGGHGELYRGTDQVTGAPVVIKRLRPELINQSPEYVIRFQREGEALHQLNHPNIVKMLAAFEQDSQYCIVMEYVAGGSLRDRLDQQTRLPADQVVAIGLELADALGRAHHLGIIHRDLKPENVLLAADGTPRLTDFGVARLEGVDARLTRTGSILGSPAYMSPEALQGEELDARSDVWSLGVLLYEMLSGQRPFKGEKITAVMLSILNDEAPEISRFQPNVPFPLADLLRRMLNKERAQRPASARLVAAELEAIRAGKSEVASEPNQAISSPVPVESASVRQPRTVHDLPAPSTAFIGREEELSDVVTLLAEPDNRLLTIVGPGGAGKSRLALAVADIVTGFTDGVFFIPLAPLKSIEHIPAVLADSLGIHLSGAEESMQQVLNYLQRRRMLLVLDNLEHLPDVAAHISRILAIVPEVKILATSRERLNLGGEIVYPLEGMSYPSQDETMEVDVTRYTAVQLLLHHAQLARPTLELTPSDLAHAVRICQLVQGLPLALVLAADWLKLLSMEEVAAEIVQSLDLLETTLSDVPARQRSMRAVFDSSWNRLTPEEQRRFSRLSVFRGGFTRQAAQAVAGIDLRSLRVLVDKSLVSVNDNSRLDIHELLRQYAEEHLSLHDGEGDVYAAHSAYYLDMLQRLEDDLKGRRQPEALDEIGAAFENVRTAWEWALQHHDEAAIDRALESLHFFCDMRHRQQEGAALFLLARDRLAPPAGQPAGRTWGRLLTRGAFLRLILRGSHWTDIEADLEQALDIARRHNERGEIGLACLALGAFTIVTGSDAARAIVLLEESYACYEVLKDHFYLSRTLAWLAHVHFTVSGVDKYRELLNQELELARQVGSQVDIAFTLMNLADAAIGLGDYLAAERYIEEATPIAASVTASGVIAYSYVIHSFVVFLLRGNSDRSRALLKKGWQRAVDIDYEVTLAYYLAINSVITAVESGNYVGARQDAEKSLAMPNNNGLGIIIAHWGLSIAHCGLENEEAAWRALQATVQHVGDFKSRAILTWLLPLAALLLARQAHKEHAVELLALAATHPLSPTAWQEEWSLLVELRPRLEQELGHEAFRAAWEQGKTLQLEQALQWLADPGDKVFTAAPTPPGSIRHMLPADTTPFLGREEELDHICRMLAEPDCRLLTLVGLGGMGKSRLALEAARQIDERSTQFRHGVLFIPLAGLDSADTLPYELANAAGLSLHTSRDDPVTVLINYLREREILVLLDNLEHLLTKEHVTRVMLLVGRLLQGCPRLKLLVTSREPLQTDGEWQVNIDGLPYPHDSAPDSDEYPAIQLFLQAARQLQPDFSLTSDSEPDVRQLCRLVSGIPLALKLAASWLKVMPLAQIVAEIERSLDLLVSRFRDVPPRQRSMRVIFDYTWELLTEPEQRVFYTLAIFRDSCSAAAAFEVAGATPFLIAGLVDRGLVQSRKAGAVTRYQMHELVRQYAAGRLPDAERDLLRKRYCDYYAALLQRCQPLLQQKEYQGATAEIAIEMDNVRLAWALALALVQEQPAKAAALIAKFTPALHFYYYINGPLQIALQTFSEASQVMHAVNWHLPDDTPAAGDCYATLLLVQIRVAFFSLGLGDYDTVDRILTPALPELRTADNVPELALALSIWGKTNLLRGQRALAETQLQESLTLFRQVEDRYHEADVLKVLGVVAVDRGQHEETMRYYHESLAIFRDLGFTPGMTSILHNIGTANFRQHDYESALAAYQEARTAAQTVGYDRIIMESTGAIGGVYRELGKYQQAESHFKQSVAMARNMGEQRHLAVNLNGLGRVYLEMNDLAAARHYLREGMMVAEATQNIPDVLSGISAFAQIWARQEDVEKALQALLFVGQQRSARATDIERNQRLLDELEAELPPSVIDDARTWAGAHTLPEIVALTRSPALSRSP